MKVIIAILGDKTATQDAKRVNINNLHRIVNFCENMTDCRRAQQLEYFAEFYTREQCLQNRATACDNCLRVGQYKEMDVTPQAQIIGNAVRQMCMGNNRFTLLHMVEVLKGSEIKKLMENGHNRSPYYAQLKTWERGDVQRLLHKMIIEEYLEEHFIIIRDIPQVTLIYFFQTLINCN